MEIYIIYNDNNPNSEKLIDALGDYVSNGTVDILDIMGIPRSLKQA